MKPSPTGQSGPAVLGPYDLTTIPSGAHIQGFTVLDSLYMRDGTFFVVTADESQFPSRLDMIAKPIIKAEGVDSEPTDQDLLFLHPSTEILGGRVIRISGLSVIVNDPPSTMNNFYNWWGEIILGAWRVYSQLSVEGNSTLPLPSRFILPAVSNGEWRDKAEMTGPLMRIAFPHASVEQSDYWQDLVKLNSTVVFDRVILVSREAAYRHPYASRWLKMISGAMKLDIPTNFWQPIRDMVVDNMLGYLPILNESGAVVAPSQARPSSKPVVTYISRQESTRRLDEKDHEALIDALQALEDEGICEFHILGMERSTLLEQIKRTSTTTILVGVHGIGLTHQLWMPQSPKATLLEIVWPKAYVFDHEIIARNLGHKHYAVWNDTEVTYPEGNYYKGIYYGDEFNSNAIPVYGPTVVKIIKDRLSF
ncbi:hypothetical protein GALMADRAFT_73703 [Galerina marginata CBS 339.88]|uniref:Glycosyltransferase 61 catalytic domain-containing protein n=1 Tax=Galerina marginata (strain CBS 339.88) TaxID=685588 RepID=A0A067SPA5_GALM3|nr:hypothetical protein GALMADRAFT_73703 [Galerina marginata CBS 339.88]